jgi:hypothetical protein
VQRLPSILVITTLIGWSTRENSSCLPSSRLHRPTHAPHPTHGRRHQNHTDLVTHQMIVARNQHRHHIEMAVEEQRSSSWAHVIAKSQLQTRYAHN